MNKKLQHLMIIIIVIIVVIGIIMTIYPYPFFGPFEYPPKSAGGNCDQEYRFKFDTKINSVDEFIQFLKGHRYEGNLVRGYIPTKENLIPSHATYIIGPNSPPGPQNESMIPPINLDELKDNVTIESSKAIFSNEKIYCLIISGENFNDSYPWGITVKMSETGHISIQYCAGV